LSNRDILTRIGWTDAFEPHMAKHDGLIPARVLVQHRGSYVVASEIGELHAETSGRMRHNALGTQDLPVVGDWVALAARDGEVAGTIHALLPRRTKFSRKSAGMATEEQVLAANMDWIFVVTSLNADLNLRRIERYLTLAWESGAVPVVVLTKVDLAGDPVVDLDHVSRVTVGVSVHAVSALTGTGLDELTPYFSGGRTAALLGSSGSGKSTLTNALVGDEVQRVADIRGDGKGRHTTTHRELVFLPGGGAVIDSPGMRELQLWDSEEGMSSAFEDIESLAEDCRFRDCGHNGEPGCAVAQALQEGRLDLHRLESYRKLQRELHFLSLKKDARARAAENRKWRAISRAQRDAQKPTTGRR
jgi:ribosome biogenesis GTPase / thiamine phosphate phosphatase